MASTSGAQEAPPLVPMLKTGNSPSNNRGTWERIEWQSYSTTRGYRPRSAADFGGQRFMVGGVIGPPVPVDLLGGGPAPSRYSGTPSKSVVGQSSVVA